MNLSKLERRLLNYFEANPVTRKTIQELANIFNYRGSKNYKKLVKAATFLEQIGKIQLNQQNQYYLPEELNQVQGTFRANDKGFGFVTFDPEQPDLFVPKGQSNGAMDGDLVEVKIVKQINPATGKGSEAHIKRIIERSHQQLVGEFFAYDPSMQEKTGYLGFVLPRLDSTNHMMVMVLADGIKPVDRSIVVIKIKDYPNPLNNQTMTGLVAKEIGHKDDPGVDILEILYQFSIPHQFPENVIKQANNVPDHVKAEEITNRTDLRDELVITIDGADAKDLDDAISLAKIGDTYQLKVHIADVSYYVERNSPIDHEAYERGTSVYLTDRVVPMLPQRLSNEICSLNPQVDRLTITCQMTINQNGKVESYKLYPSVINSNYRMTYTDVNAILAGDKELHKKYKEIVPMLKDMAQLHNTLSSMRKRRGAINFDTKEAKISVDNDGHPTNIQVVERGVGERMIESFMLAANETVAKHFADKELPFIYRIHESPDPDKIEHFAKFAAAFGLVVRGKPEIIKPGQLQKILKEAQGQPYEPALTSILLRSMQQAKYSTEPIGHFGLATNDYTHFTSPIRRYPDLIVHRMIRAYWFNQTNKNELHSLQQSLPDIADHASKAERRAVDAERETDALKKAEYMAERIGEVYEGVISSVTSFGIFVELPNTVEGLVHIDRLKNDHYQYHPEFMMLIGEHTNQILQIGQTVTVEVSAVDIEQREIDFELVDTEEIQENNANLKHRIKKSQHKNHKENRIKTRQNQPKKGKPKKTRQFKIRKIKR